MHGLHLTSLLAPCSTTASPLTKPASGAYHSSHQKQFQGASMRTVAVLLAPGFEEIEAITVIDYLRRAEIGVTTVAVPADGAEGTTVTGSHGIPVVADTTLAAYRAARTVPDAIYSPGGMPGAANIGANADALDLIAAVAGAGKLVAALCAAPVVVLAKTGLLAGRRYTCYPGMEESL
ncbi:MAG: DJ-1/PfpI family protein, partial [Treponema sp.]|nr:DJ-1/PfpI family protein [Treponema sp.]